ncbi:complex I NDUFA9 subunit family protein [Rhizobium sp. VS19-DR104.2]|uniref:complex I NDUFA9 subunit family protein n=1 Tax=unclassified Rhizobium TaxID=2613769 RepID=UPI001C5B4B08|nr:MULTISPECIES: complex I NDUFA9 subunit family protein [unclassified Rhizobium]MBZ5759656.1 complex I NDUFA9 subunit family protein [Rhizobium sp. VS19-DR96]MBZ5766045.1 complex I NDUFA9 subunit family protein [Rhizobium sp. VS19-DR129.2]MBZ5772828.1 complex I NDUFA9 subunit family protein [Rhizobium sp. VS19-DRK62.2]MBZ5786567.1 complex I NDUFA9 subunit family protein [Rhizobium sp. VS19-DR121]MBZ5804408.1 complex I NDUFA9 subunit family protein [Rhizobium sp. VS19-DR181]
MTLSNLPPLVTVFGGSGFVGRHVVRVLAKRGYRIRVAVRRPDLAGFLLTAGNVGQISAVQANLRYRDSVDRAVEGAQFVVNCVGILSESGRNTFDAVQEFGGRAIAEATRAVGAKLTHISAIGANGGSASSYGRTKGKADAAVLSIVPDSIILRPSIVFGPEDGFFNKFADMSRLAPALPLIGGGKTKFQPVYVEDVAEAVGRAVDGKLTPGTIYELGGPEVLSFRECLETILKVVNRKRPLVSIPFGVASMIGSVASMIPLITPPITPDQVTLLKVDNIVSPEAEAEGRTLAAMGIRPTMPTSVLPSYLVRFRPHGQFSGTGKAA